LLFLDKIILAFGVRTRANLSPMSLMTSKVDAISW
jgi:hypothetical protein